MSIVNDSYIVGRTGKTREVRGIIRFWKKFTQHECVIETYDTNDPRNRSQHNKWVNESAHVLSRPVFGK